MFKWQKSHCIVGDDDDDDDDDDADSIRVLLLVGEFRESSPLQSTAEAITESSRGGTVAA